MIDLVAYKQQELSFSQLKRLESPRSQCQKIQCLAGADSWFIDDYLLAVSSPDRGMREISGVYFIRVLTSFLRTPPA